MDSKKVFLLGDDGGELRDPLTFTLGNYYRYLISTDVIASNDGSNQQQNLKSHLQRVPSNRYTFHEKRKFQYP
jgi:hypothetical protein